jgi:hypothetical protein
VLKTPVWRSPWWYRPKYCLITSQKFSDLWMVLLPTLRVFSRGDPTLRYVSHITMTKNPLHPLCRYCSRRPSRHASQHNSRSTSVSEAHPVDRPFSNGGQLMCHEDASPDANLLKTVLVLLGHLMLQHKNFVNEISAPLRGLIM